jgi:hypothetical protein
VGAEDIEGSFEVVLVVVVCDGVDGGELKGVALALEGS